jgi:Phage major capsid protein E
MSKIHALAGIIGQRETAVIASVVDEITAQPVDSIGLKLMPIVAHPENIIYHEKVSGFGGLLSERVLGEEGKSGDNASSEVIPFSPGAYQESARFTENDLIVMRKLGSIGERGVTGLTAGVLDRMSRAGQNLKVKLTNRLNKMAWDTLFTGKYTYLGVTKQDFLPPVTNTVQSATDWSVPATCTPFTDLFNIVKKNPVFFKYIIKEFIINPVTEAAILTSNEARVLIQNNASAFGDINKLAQILYPGLPTINVVKDAWQDQTSVGGVITNLSAQYFVPDFKALCIVDLSGTQYGQYGELSMTYNMNDPSATPESPAMGIYSFVDENGLLKRKAPFVEVVTGFNGGANLMRSNDVLIIKGKLGI